MFSGDFSKLGQHMATIIKFPRHHTRASATSRAASRVKSSAVTPAETARPVASSSDQYSGGMLSRCHHLEICVAVVPGSSEAMASREFPQSSMTSRNDAKSVIPPSLGQMVLNCKDFVSFDCGLPLGHTVRMVENETEAQFKQEFTKRVKAARAALGWKQWQMADALDMPQDKYKQYEGRSLLPHHLIGRFCLIAHVDPVWLMTGRGEKPLQPLKSVPTAAPAAVSKPKRARDHRAA